jgi:hypothetical protein
LQFPRNNLCQPGGVKHADLYGISREEQDKLAVLSHNRARRAISEGLFKSEIVPVIIKSRRGDTVFDADERPMETNMEKMSKLRPVFKKDGSVTAGNASGINDAAAAVLLMSAQQAEDLGLEPLATIKAFASGGLDPAYMGLGPVPAHLLLALAFSFLFVAGNHQQIMVGLAETLGFVTAEVDEIQAMGVSVGGQVAEFDFPTVDAIDRHPRIDMHALGAAEPRLAQLRVSALQRIGRGEYHIMNFDPGAWVFAPEHHDKQHCRSFLAIGQGPTILRLNPFVRSMPHG